MTGEHFITIEGKDVPCQIQWIDIFQLKYFPENPRINYIISSMGDNISQDDIEREMWGVDTTKKLFRDIQRNKGLIEEIVVKDEYVIEGNTRLCAYRKLYHNAKRNNDEQGLKTWNRIRAKVLPGHITDTQIFSFLGTLHVRGKADWRPFEQASYVYRMSKVLNKKSSEISSLIGISETEVKRYIKVYEVMKHKFLSNDGTTQELEKFSYFDEYYKSREMQRLDSEDPSLIDKFCEWVREERLYKAHKQVKDLGHILQHKKAAKIFVEDNTDVAFDNAYEKLISDKPGRSDPFYNQLEKTRRLIKNTSVHEIKTQIEETPKKGDIIKKLHKEITKFCHNLGMNTKVHLQ